MQHQTTSQPLHYSLECPNSLDAKKPIPTFSTAGSWSLLSLNASKRRYLREKWAPRKATASRRRKVTFSKVATVKTRPAPLPSETWYQPVEYAQFNRDRRATIDAIQSVHGDVSILDPQVHCVRGLEHQLSKKQVLSRKLKSMRYVRTLLDEQFVQKLSGNEDPESLQILSTIFSKQASQRAHLRAILALATT